jgi:peroxiredoxin Q/BCP
VIGVSLDNEKQHQKFAAKYSLPMMLVADTDHSVSDAYGVYGKKKFMGKEYMGISRTTFLIDEKGKIVKIFDKVDVENHATEVLEAFGIKAFATANRKE